eukprot:TRINITY_DN43954_c0_g1_i1.p1 TRINITY_DN43954_c0_g1~~TRINITY_DN43954_c0_g1_i1.p1  ORF type:complete len:346 (+),score=145.15 TRINITY_DN43954_c0_g1_i1:23-1039(+)
MAAEQVHLQEALRAAQLSKRDVSDKLDAASAQCGALESQITAARDSERNHMAQLASADGAREQAMASRARIMELSREMDDKIVSLEQRLMSAVHEKGELGGALIMAEAEIMELRAAAERLSQQSSEQYAHFTVELESREERAADEVKRMEALWAKSLTDMQKMRAKLEESAIAKGSLMGELDAVRSGATTLSVNVMNAEHERDKALEEINRLKGRLLQMQSEVEVIEVRASQAVSSRGELEGLVDQLKVDLQSSQEAARAAQESLHEHRSQSATEKSTLESHINVLAAGLQDLEYQLQVAATRTNDLEGEVLSTEQDTYRAVEVTSGLKTPGTVSPPT